ncbi:MAG TPA: cell wall hydrolase [Bacillota bacterium]|nr:cell wall hydrolase [Bacillota bacterium]
MLHQKIASSALLTFLTVFSLSSPVALLSQSQIRTQPMQKQTTVAIRPKTSAYRKSPTAISTQSQSANSAVKSAAGTAPVVASANQNKWASTSVAKTVKTEPKTTAPVNVTGAQTVQSQPPVQPTYQTAIRQNQTVPAGSNTAVSNYQFQILARIISAEAKGEPMEGQVAVGAVILNRVKSGKFPDTIAANVLKRGQFEPVANGHIWREPTSSAIRAARLALKGWDPTNGALYFYNPVKSSSRWIWSRTVITRIGNHVFAV